MFRNDTFMIFARLLYYFYGYEALNLLFKVSPSRVIVQILRQFGASIGGGVRIQAPFIIHNADQTKPIYQNLKKLVINVTLEEIVS